jgi:hypothetical protein
MMFVSEIQRKAAFANMHANNSALSLNNQMVMQHNQFAYTPIYAAGDFGAMGIDVIGAGAHGAVAGASLAAGIAPLILLPVAGVWGLDKLRGSKNVEKLLGPQTKTIIGKPIKAKAREGQYSKKLVEAKKL